MSEISVREVLEQELSKRFYITQCHLSVDDLFRGEGIATWIKALFSAQRMEVLGQRIDKAPPLRLLHAVSTYLLGITVREGAGIGYGSLPRIFSVSTAGGDAFSFFWSGICLCHDLGFGYEELTDPAQKDKMLSREGRQELLGLEYDLLSLERADYPDGLTTAETDWVEEALRLANRYSEYRLKGMDGEHRRIDHGIAGAAILYDALRRQAADAPFRRPASGEFEVNAGYSRFGACCLLMACTIARHNMWTASPEAISTYQSFGLDSLCPGPELRLVAPEKPEEQMLFLLDFMDTVDPVKNLYVRAAESGLAVPGELEARLRFLLDCVCVSFDRGWELDYRWAEFLPHRQITISAVSSTPDEEGWMEDYLGKLKGMSGWLDTKDPDICPGRAVCYYPRQRAVERTWPGGITDREIDSICLYVGSGVPGKVGRFYQIPNAYQTFNLLMMEGLEGERTRVCIEGQTPDPIYIRDWQRTLEVFTDIFHAQCRWRDAAVGQKAALPQPLYRADRKLNVERMRSLERTFAFTSVSKGGYIPSFAVGKQDPALVEITVGGNCPYLDLAAVLQDDYVYANEAELLFPPFVSAEVCGGDYLTTEQIKECGLYSGFPVLTYQASFGGFCGEDDGGGDPYALIQHLERDKECAAQTLEAICKCRSLDGFPKEEIQSYADWKKSFFRLVGLCFSQIWEDVP